MRKKSIPKKTALILLIIISACTAVKPSPSAGANPTTDPENSTIAAPSSTPITYSETAYTTAEELTFGDTRFLQHFDLLGTFDLEGNENLGGIEDIRLENGAWVFGGTALSGANFKSKITYDSGVHLRWKVIGKDTCHAFMLIPLLSQHEPLPNSVAAGLGGCASQNVQLEIQGSLSAPSLSEGRTVFVPDTWIEAVLWVEKEPEPILKLFAWESNNPQAFTIAKIKLETWQQANAYMLAIEHYEDGLEASELVVQAFFCKISQIHPRNALT